MFQLAEAFSTSHISTSRGSLNNSPQKNSTSPALNTVTKQKRPHPGTGEEIADNETDTKDSLKSWKIGGEEKCASESAVEDVAEEQGDDND